jgi:tRNA-binding protein
MNALLTYADFEKVALRIGTVIRAEHFPEARKPALKLWIDFGALGVKASSAQITNLYTPETLVGSQVLAVTNLAPRRIGSFISEVLVTGFYNDGGHVVLARPQFPVSNGARLV